MHAELLESSFQEEFQQKAATLDLKGHLSCNIVLLGCEHENLVFLSLSEHHSFHAGMIFTPRCLLPEAGCIWLTTK